MANIRGERAGSMKNLRKSLKKGAGGGTFIKRVPQNDSILVRFLTEPEDWFGYYEHYDSNSRNYYPCVEDDCPGCADDERRSFRYLANALDVDNDRVVPLKLPKSLANRIVIKFDKYNTIMDRDYDLISSGEGLDTEYDVDPESKMKRNLAKYDHLDLGAILEESWENVFGDSNDDDDDDSDDEGGRPSARRTRSGGSRRSASSSSSGKSSSKKRSSSGSSKTRSSSSKRKSSGGSSSSARRRSSSSKSRRRS